MAKYIKQNNPFEPIIFLHSHADNKSQDKYLNPLIGKGNMMELQCKLVNQKMLIQEFIIFLKNPRLGEKMDSKS